MELSSYPIFPSPDIHTIINDNQVSDFCNFYTFLSIPFNQSAGSSHGFKVMITFPQIKQEVKKIMITFVLHFTLTIRTLIIHVLQI